VHRGLDAEDVRAIVLDYPGDASWFGPELRRDFRVLPGPVAATALYPLTDLRTTPTQIQLRVRGS
jgi:hypothetical protein